MYTITGNSISVLTMIHTTFFFTAEKAAQGQKIKKIFKKPATHCSYNEVREMASKSYIPLSSAHTYKHMNLLSRTCTTLQILCSMIKCTHTSIEDSLYFIIVTIKINAPSAKGRE